MSSSGINGERKVGAGKARRGRMKNPPKANRNLIFGYFLVDAYVDFRGFLVFGKWF